MTTWSLADVTSLTQLTCIFFRQKHLAVVAPSDSSNASTPGRLVISRQGSYDPWEELAMCKRQMADQQDCIARREGTLARLLQVLPRAQVYAVSVALLEKTCISHTPEALGYLRHMYCSRKGQLSLSRAFRLNTIQLCASWNECHHSNS